MTAAGATDATAAIVLAGGRASRMGADKTGLFVEGTSLLDRVLAACLATSQRVVVVGDVRPRLPASAVTVVVEDPPDAGPVHALAAGVAQLMSDVRDEIGGQVYVLAADLPFLTAGALRRLQIAPGQAAVVAVDDHGRDQFLLARWRTQALVAALSALQPTAGRSVRGLYAGVDYGREALGGHPPPWWDCDTPQDLAAARKWTGKADHHDS